MTLNAYSSFSCSHYAYTCTYMYSNEMMCICVHTYLDLRKHSTHAQMPFKTDCRLELHTLGMGDIDILAYDYCEASISRLSQLLN